MKYFHELTKQEFEDTAPILTTWNELSKAHPQPPWCGYPDAICGVMGCWALMSFEVKNADSCRNCECFKEKFDDA